MGLGGRGGRGGSTSRQDSDGSYKESAKSDVKMTADKIRKLVAKFLKELSSKTNPSLLVFLGSWFVLLSEETTHAWMFMRELKYVTDPELINQYIMVAVDGCASGPAEAHRSPAQVPMRRKEP